MERYGIERNEEKNQGNEQGSMEEKREGESGRTTGMAVVPGVECYSEIVRHQRNEHQRELTPKTYIFSSSITRDIDQGLTGVSNKEGQNFTCLGVRRGST